MTENFKHSYTNLLILYISLPLRYPEGCVSFPTLPVTEDTRPNELTRFGAINLSSVTASVNC